MDSEVFELQRYVNPEGKDVVGDWLNRLRDDRAHAKVLARLHRLQVGNFGDCKTLASGVSELRIDHGPGYRVYFAKIERRCVLLLCGGDKRS